MLGLKTESITKFLSVTGQRKGVGTESIEHNQTILSLSEKMSSGHGANLFVRGADMIILRIVKDDELLVIRVHFLLHLVDIFLVDSGNLEYVARDIGNEVLLGLNDF